MENIRTTVYNILTNQKYNITLIITKTLRRELIRKRNQLQKETNINATTLQNLDNLINVLKDYEITDLKNTITTEEKEKIIIEAQNITNKQNFHDRIKEKTYNLLETIKKYKNQTWVDQQILQNASTHTNKTIILTSDVDLSIIKNAMQNLNYKVGHIIIQQPKTPQSKNITFQHILNILKKPKPTIINQCQSPTTCNKVGAYKCRD